jgi:hypothetical protein
MGRRDAILSWLGAPVARALDERVDDALGRRASADAARVAALEERVEQLAKKLAMVTGSVTAAAERVGGAQEVATEALALARQAMVVAGTARATAESAIDPTPVERSDGCRVTGCAGSHRARGFCAAHYNRWRRNVLDGFVGPKGEVRVEDRELHVDPVFAADAYDVAEGHVRIAGRTVPVRRA